MPIDARCSCGKHFFVADSLAGRRARCPFCKLPILIPSARGPVIAAPPSRPNVAIPPISPSAASIPRPVGRVSQPAAPRRAPRWLWPILIAIPVSLIGLAALGYGAFRLRSALDPRPKITVDVTADRRAYGWDLRNRLDECFGKHGIATAPGQPLTAHLTGRKIGSHPARYERLGGADETVDIPDIELHFWITNTAGTTLWERRGLLYGKTPRYVPSSSSFAEKVEGEVWLQATDAVNALDLPPPAFVAVPPAAPPPGGIDPKTPVIGP